MKFSLLLRLAFASIFALGYSGCGASKPAAEMGHGDHEGHGHAESGKPSQPAPALIVTSNPAKPTALTTTKLRLMLHDSSGQMAKDFEPVHEKLAHFIIVKEGLDQFAHLHPVVKADGMMTVDYTFPVGGTYYLFLDHKEKKKPQSTAQAMIEVEGNAPAPQPLVPNVPGTLKGDGLDARVTLAPSEGSSAQTMTFLVTDSAGNPVNDLQTYLGAMGHLVVLSANAKEYVHAHPKDVSGADGIVPFDVHFPGAGLYKAWGQFQRDGKVYTIPAVVEVSAAKGHH